LVQRNWINGASTIEILLKHTAFWEDVMSLGFILLIILVLFLFGALPRWPHSANWGYRTGHRPYHRRRPGARRADLVRGITTIVGIGFRQARTDIGEQTPTRSGKERAPAPFP
jgi:hypothetical protein